MVGGPNKNPIKPIVETAASEAPGVIVPDFPAALYTKGTTEETPKPTNRKPPVAATIVGIMAQRFWAWAILVLKQVNR